MGGANTQQWNPNSNDLRADGSLKGKGFLGVLPRIDDPKRVSSEISIGVDWGNGEKEIPTMVPTLDKNEINYLLSNESNYEANPQMWSSIRKKAVEHAKQREAQGLPYFAQSNESPKQPKNIMGGLNTQTQLETTGNPAMDAAKEQQTYDQLKAQGMSGAADESLEKYIRGGKNLVKEMMAKASSNPNYNRDVNTTSLDPASVAKKADLEMVKNKLSSYDAIDLGLGK